MHAPLREGKIITLDDAFRIRLKKNFEIAEDIVVAFKNYFSNIFTSSCPTHKEIYQSTRAIEPRVIEVMN